MKNYVLIFRFLCLSLSQEQKDNLFVEGTKLRKGERSSIIVKKQQSSSAGDDDDADESNGDAAAEPVDLQREFQEQEQLQRETQAVLRDMKAAEEAGKDTSIETCQAYLQEVRIEVRERESVGLWVIIA